MFDGTAEEHDEEEAFAPLGVYRQTKAAGDIAVANATRHYILHSSWVIGEGRNFVKTMMALSDRVANARDGLDEITVVDDQYGRLTFTRDNEPLLPSDLNFITGGNTGELTSFIPISSQPLVHQAIAGVIWLVVICIVLQILDRRNCFIHCSWRHPFTGAKNIVGTLTRIAAAYASVAVAVSFTWGFGNAGYWSTNLAQQLGDEPQMWNGLTDSTNNGPAVNFARLAHTKIMDKPEDYSRDVMKKIAAKYAKQAKNINQTRSANMTDNTVIIILSETFSDPTRVPGVSFSEDPMPNIRQLKTWTTSGLMLSPGYGGGTANIEYQALTGLSMANYSSALSVAYQQLVPPLKWTPSLNQAWNAANGEDASVALHAYNRNMYFRDINYKKFAFSKFYATDGVPPAEGPSANRFRMVRLGRILLQECPRTGFIVRQEQVLSGRHHAEPYAVRGFLREQPVQGCGYVAESVGHRTPEHRDLRERSELHRSVHSQFPEQVERDGPAHHRHLLRRPSARHLFNRVLRLEQCAWPA